MTRNLFLALIAVLFAFGAAGLHTSQTISAEPADQKTTVGNVTTVMFYNLYPRLNGEDEFYLVMSEEDLGRAQAVAEAVNNCRIARSVPVNAVAVSGNLVRVTLPPPVRGYAVQVASSIADAEVLLPAADPDDPVPTQTLMDLLKKDPDDMVRLNAAITLGRRKEMDAYAALTAIASSEEGWVRRGAIYAMSNFQAANGEEMQKVRAEFLNGINAVLRLLQTKPVTDEELKKQVKELQAAFGDVLAYYRLFQVNSAESDELDKAMTVLHELLADVAALYPDEDKVKVDKLIEAAAKGVTEYLDKFSVLWDKEGFEKFQQNTEGKFVGIGVFVDKDDEGFKIISPIFGSPAYHAGLQARDQILTVDGEDIKDLDMEVLRHKIAGEPGSTVKIEIIRKGWDNPRVFEIKRGVITLPLVLHAMLPGGIGYLRLLQFSDESPQQIEAALDDLNKQGLKGLVLDLRNNPGGTLQSALKIASMFLPKGVVVTSLKGRKENRDANQVHHTDQTTKRQDNYPIIVMVNAASASAAELLSGALRDHKRATIIGQTTYGKGSGQNIFPILTSKGERFLKLTVFKYYLPSDVCIHEVGVKPDISLPKEEAPEWQIEDASKITLEILNKYIEQHYENNAEIFEALAKDDGCDAGRYPGFEEFYKSLGTKLDQDAVRRILRNRVRMEVSNRSSKLFSCDLQEDRELQRGVYEMMRKIGVNPADVEEFKAYSERIAKEIEEAAKPEEGQADASKNSH